MAHRVKNPPAVQETQKIQIQFLGQEDPLEEAMATHSSILTWKIQWTEDPGGCSPWGHKESDKTEGLRVRARARTHTHTHTHTYTHSGCRKVPSSTLVSLHLHRAVFFFPLCLFGSG